MEAVLVRATVATASAVSQAHGHGCQFRAILAERSNFAMSHGATAETSWKGVGQSGFLASDRAAKSQTEMLGSLRISWNSNIESQPLRISEELLQEDGEGFVNYETLDGSVADHKEGRLDRECTSVAHTEESFAKFLRHFPATDLKDVAQACYLSNLAYVISEIKEDELQKDYRLRLVTSSIHQGDSGAAEQISKTLAPATAYALVATASYLQSRNSSSAGGSKPSLSEEAFSRAVDHQLSSAVSSFMESAESCPDAATIGEETSPSSSATACGWFVCDEPTTATRIFAIQGSESVASWKANLRFQPTQFEDSSSGVMVHKGVYEITKSLYNQMLPLVRSHMAAYGKRARISFTGHSLGGSLAVLLSLMFRYRGVVPVSALRQVYTFGAPSVMNGGNNLLKRLGFPPNHIQSVVMARDLIPRIFACDMPEQVVQVLRRVNKNFRNLNTFVNQKQLYNPTGKIVILQPQAQQAPGHPLLPSGSGLYVLDQPAMAKSQDLNAMNVFEAKELRAAESSFLNSPHPLEIMSDPTAYGPEGAISRDHDPRSYRKAVNHVLKQTVRGLQRRKRIELWHLKGEMAEFPAVSWPPSPADTSKRSKRMSETSALFFNNDSFSRASSAGVCNYLNLGLRKTLNSGAPGQPRFTTRSTHVSENTGSRHCRSVVSLKH